MGAPAPAFDELDGSRVLHALGAFAIDLQDFIADLRKERKRRRKTEVGGGGERQSDR